MEKTHTVLFMDGRKQDMTGKIFMFTPSTVGLTQIGNATYLNAGEVLSITPQPSDKGGE